MQITVNPLQQKKALDSILNYYQAAFWYSMPGKGIAEKTQLARSLSILAILCRTKGYSDSLKPASECIAFVRDFIENEFLTGSAEEQVYKPIAWNAGYNLLPFAKFAQLLEIKEEILQAQVKALEEAGWIETTEHEKQIFVKLEKRTQDKLKEI